MLASPKLKKTEKARIGINLNGVNDASTEEPFIDLFKQSREWISHQTGKGWGQGPKLALDAHGWIKQLAPGGYATRFISTSKSIAAGKYVVLYEGEGKLKLHGDVRRVVSSKPGRIVVSVTPKWGEIKLDLQETNPDNYVRNIRFLPLAYEKSYQEKVWSEDFIQRWTGVSCLRMMDFMETNHSKQARWAERPKPSDASYAIKGVPVELMVDLANRLQSDVWFCMPHMADDEYVQQFAAYVAKHLDPSLNVWIEYSNEVWNGMFSQSNYTAQQGKRLGLSKIDWQAKSFYTAKRSVEMFKLWQAAFTDNSRVVRVLAGQASSTPILTDMLNFNKAASHTDVIAIAPYFGMAVSKSREHGLTDQEVQAWSLDRMFKHVNEVLLPESYRAIDEHVKLANRYGVGLAAYEGGQHLVGIFGGENNETLTELFFAANADPRMGEAYARYLSYWQQSGSGLFCLFNSMGQWTKWGSWGLLRDRSENAKNAPKFGAVVAWAKAQGQSIGQ